MLAALGRDELTWVIHDASQKQMAKERWAKGVDVNGVRIFITTWQLRQGDTAAAFDLSDADIEDFGQAVVNGVAQTIAAEPFDFPVKIPVGGLKTLQHLNKQIYKQFSKAGVGQ